MIWSQELLWSFVHGNYEASDISQTINSPGGKKLKLLYQYPVEIKQEKVFALPKNITKWNNTVIGITVTGNSTYNTAMQGKKVLSLESHTLNSTMINSIILSSILRQILNLLVVLQFKIWSIR